MYFDFAAFIRYNFKSFFLARGKNYRLTAKRFIVLFIWLIIYIPGELIWHFFLLLDEVFYPHYHQQEITRPIFIIGNPRSGTTFLHRLMEKDSEHFTSFKVWELIFAPSITQRKLILGVIKIAGLIGAPVQKGMQSLNKRLARRTKRVHAVRIDAAEEDEYILIHGWCSEALWPLYPIPEELLPYFFFDRDIPPKQKDRVMRFYKNMVQRHLYAHGGKKMLLSKNPSQSAKMESLLKIFPDARFINLARNPMETIPSMIDYMATGWELFCDPLEKYPHQEEFFKVMGYYYRYPIEFFADKPDIGFFMRYDALVDAPERMVKEVYDFLDLDMSIDFAALLTLEAEKARAYQSEHIYSLEEMNLTTEQINSAFADVINFYEFGASDNVVPENTMFIKIKEWRLARQQRRRIQANKRKRLLRKRTASVQ